MSGPKETKDMPASQPELEGDDAVIGRALIRSLMIFIPLAIAVVVVIVILMRPDPKPEASETEYVKAKPRNPVSLQLPQVKFTDITEEAGIQFVHCNGAYGDKLLPETMGGGVGFWDFDKDGDQDLLFVNSNYWPWKASANGQQPTMALYANDGNGKFTDVTSQCGLDITMYGMGLAIGDYDNDGWQDVFFSGVGPNRLFKNENGKFREVTREAGVAGGDDQWGTSCGWLDYNNDGLLDLFVCNYVRWSKKTDLKLKSTLDGVNRAYGPPEDFDGAFPCLYRNEGEGKFSDVSEEVGIRIKNRLTGVPISKSLGVIFVDIDKDDWVDIVVANDTVQNLLFRNVEGERFEEQGALAGIAFDGNGEARGAMGIDEASFRDSDSIGIAIGNFANEPASLYVARRGRTTFSDEALSTGLGPQTKHFLTFGLFFFDSDLDGRLDVLVANGHLEDEINKTQKTQFFEQSPQLFWNAGLDQRTELVPLTEKQTGADFQQALVGRGAAYADIDGDGDLDVVITTTGRGPRLLRNDQQLGHHWLRIRLTGTTSNRDAVGAQITLVVDGRKLVRRVSRTRSYLSQMEDVVTFGLGTAEKVDSLQVRWPDGTVQSVEVPEVDRLLEISQNGPEAGP